MRYLRKKIDEFLVKRGFKVEDVIYQCDHDCVDFAKTNALSYVDGGCAYLLADVVAWLNNNNREPPGVILMGLVDVIEKEMNKKFK